jgi:glycopeptide antibiotics resistance protein
MKFGFKVVAASAGTANGGCLAGFVSDSNWPRAILMTDSCSAVGREPPTPSWSNRILVAAVVGILFLTLYPFRFSLVRHGPPFLLAGWGKDAGVLDVFLNLLLFVPYGFGLAERLRERGKSRASVLGVTFLAGALFSYSVELLQFYIPMRDSGWGDVVTNSSGSVLGLVVYELAGAATLRVASRMESAFVTWLDWRRLIIVLLFYVGVWLGASIPLQRQARISDWAPEPMLLIGSSAEGEPDSAWNGKVSEVDFWNRALPDHVARAITAGDPNEGPAPSVSYNLSGPPPYQDQRHVLPGLVWVRGSSPPAPPVVGASWLMSRAPISALVDQVERTNRFALRVLCQPGLTAFARNRRLVIIAQFPGHTDLELSQEGTRLIFWFRNPLSAKRPRLTWDVPNVFAPNETRNLLLSYDGSRLTLYVDGRKDGRPYQLDPGTGLALHLRRVKSGELDGYHYIFYALVFLPAGCLLGLGWRKLARQTAARVMVMLLGVLVVPVIFEICLALAGSTTVWLGNIALSMLLVLAGAFWLNADHWPGSRNSAELALK